MELHNTFRIDGIGYDRVSLIQFCKTSIKQGAAPEWKKEIFTFILEWLDPSRSDFEQMTSGTTGDPKSLRLQRSAMIRSAMNTLEHFNLRAGQRIMLCLPVRYIAGKMMVVRAMVGGLELVIVPPSGRPVPHLDSPVAFAAMVPLQVHESLKYGDDLSIMHTLLIGGGEIHPVLREKLSDLDRPRMYESFAMTETYTHFALRKINGSDAEATFRPMRGVAVSTDERGCLVVAVDGVTKEPVRTSDLVEIAGNGQEFTWLGRADHIIKSGGIKIIPEDLEQKIREVLGMECLVLPEPDPGLGERLLLLIESAEPDPPLERWKQMLRDALPGYEVPKRIVTTANIPRNTSFKPDRNAAVQMIRNA